ncbi:hypothetical protein J2N86_16045 (plasmid) [Legionella lytica]|uniref:Uncharacterized protein n=1 Tax=Legionella lytica TaxID=96232 RepID=A0ABY4YD57_9GAMM|nr:hypothetical protein [Legionella lytica]USQ15536.1 hypothetical protein J2N86_16045 [Legionella lytica]
MEKPALTRCSVEIQYIENTLKLMGELNIRTRDTYDLNYNFDDKLTHGIENGPRLLKIEWVDTDKFTGCVANNFKNEES